MRWAQIAVDGHGDDQEIVVGLLSGFAPHFSATDTSVSIYLPVDERLEEILLTLRERLRETLGGREITITFVAEEDWAHAWKQYFKPQRIGSRIVVKPTWEAFTPENGDVVIEIDPGMAFGTGLHATTRLCLRALETYLSPGDTVADVGTGSGILAVGAIRLGASSVTATDNDPLAVDIARENARVNGVTAQVAVSVAETPPMGPFDIVVANILPDVILGMRQGLLDAVRPGGLLITSGIIQPRAGDVRDGMTGLGMEFVDAPTEGEWVAVLLRRPG